MGRRIARLEVETVEDEVEKKGQLLGFQVFAILMLIGSSLLVWFIEWVNPDFFNFPYLQAPTLESFHRYWPLLAYAFGMAVLSTFSGKLCSTEYDHQLLKLNITTSILAGVWEELGFRCIFVCICMLGIVIGNWFLAGLLSLVLSGILIFLGVVMCAGARDAKEFLAQFLGFLVGLVVIGTGVFVGYLCFTGTNPESWMYEHIFVPVINLVTFKSFDSIFSGKYPQLFIFGMVAANAKFRDGHKYQGPVGILNSWIVGFVMIHVTLTAGLWMAIILHVVYDVEFAVVHHLARKINSGAALAQQEV